MTLTFKSGVDVPLAVQAETMNRAFEGYLAGDIHVSPEAYAAMLARDSVDLNKTQIAFSEDGEAIAIGMVAWRGGQSRLAAMGVVKGTQEKGIGTQLMQHLLQQARERKDSHYYLECFEQNERGIKLYERHGFVAKERLYGYQAPTERAEKAIPFSYEQVPMLEVAQAMIAYGAPDLPWQMSGYTLSKLGAPMMAIKSDACYAVISDPNSGGAVLWSVVVLPEYQRQGHARRFVQGLLDAYPEKPWHVPQLCPESVGVKVLEPLGFVRDELHQVHMVCALYP
jgi:GNAT superfamily N-acetyltransferase